MRASGSQRLVVESVSPRVNCPVPRTAPPNPQSERRAHEPETRERKPAREPRGHRHHLAHHEKSESRRHADPHGARDLDRAPEARRLRGGHRHEAEHQGRDEDGEDGDERVVRQLREPGFEEALRGLEEEQRDEERPEREQHRERDLGEREEKDRVDRGKSDDEVDAKAGQVVGEIAIQDPALLDEEIRGIAALEDDLVDDGDRVEGTDDAGRELGRAR